MKLGVTQVFVSMHRGAVVGTFLLARRSHIFKPMLFQQPADLGFALFTTSKGLWVWGVGGPSASLGQKPFRLNS